MPPPDAAATASASASIFPQFPTQARLSPWSIATSIGVAGGPFSPSGSHVDPNNHCAVSLSTSSSVSTTAGPGVFRIIDSPMLDELPSKDSGGLDAELDEDVNSGTEDDDEGTGLGMLGSGDAVRATLEFVSGGPVSTEPARDTEAEDGRDNDIAR